ncbi:MAG: UPF0158 family protein [Spirochaetia bacterium]|nr:UPF0158 family protein [Spirochaetia bacterium]MDD7269022.1 UPF0158 family protein [Treponema sp.]MDY4985069.1 UPF0158 family protein [Treponema sp.]
MTFELTEKLTDSIISAMDNQEKIFVVNAAAGQLVEEMQADEENFYSLPEWGSAEGFAMREEFVAALHSPIVHDELMAVLHSGRGVFKNFRIILKSYPEIDKRWHIFKNRYMSARINDWYNSLREVWGLEKLDYFTESDDALIHDDFSFEEYESKAYKNEVLSNITAGIYDDENLPSEVLKVINEMWRNQFEQAEAAAQTGYICRSLSDDFAGCITASSLTENQEKIMFITSLFVPEQFRGLGIGTELISMCISKLQSMGKKFIIMPNFIAPEIIQPLLNRTGFEKISSGYLLAL